MTWSWRSAVTAPSTRPPTGWSAPTPRCAACPAGAPTSTAGCSGSPPMSSTPPSTCWASPTTGARAASTSAASTIATSCSRPASGSTRASWNGSTPIRGSRLGWASGTTRGRGSRPSIAITSSVRPRLEADARRRDGRTGSPRSSRTPIPYTFFGNRPVRMGEGAALDSGDLAGVVLERASPARRRRRSRGGRCPSAPTSSATAGCTASAVCAGCGSPPRRSRAAAPGRRRLHRRGPRGGVRVPAQGDAGRLLTRCGSLIAAAVPCTAVSPRCCWRARRGTGCRRTGAPPGPAAAHRSTAGARTARTGSTAGARPAGSGSAAPRIAGCRVLPADNPWNQRVDRLPVAARLGAADRPDRLGRPSPPGLRHRV